MFSVNEDFDWPDPSPPLPWLLHDGPATADAGQVALEGTARIWFTVMDKPTVRYDFSAESEGGILGSFDDNEWKLSVSDGVSTTLATTEEGDQSSGWTSSHTAAGTRMRGDAKNLTGGDGSRLDLLRFHLVNFGDSENPARLFEADGWTVRIAPTGIVPRPNHFAVTHTLDLVRADRSTFSIDDGHRARGWLFDALTFATGRVVGFAVAQGHRDGIPMFIEASCTKADPWKTRRSWWDQRSVGNADLAELCSRWAEAAKDDRTQRLLRRASGCYTSALTPEPLDTAVPIAGIGVELMVWELAHQRNQLLSTAEFERLSLASRLRLALNSIGISTTLPTECSALHAHVAGSEVPDGPFAFADVRNRLVHPPKKQRGWPARDVMTEAWLLGVEYLALLVLHALGFQGKYRSQFNYNGWAGTEVPVPWAEPDPRR